MQSLELDEEASSTTTAGTKLSRKRQRITIDNLIGQAVIHCAQGKTSSAIEILHEIIRQDARRPESYLQLAVIYELEGDIAKSFEYRQLSCFLSKETSADEWNYTGDIAMSLNRLEEAAVCFRKAFGLEKTNWMYFEKQIEAYDKLGRKTNKMKSKLYDMKYLDNILNSCYISLDLSDSEPPLYVQSTPLYEYEDKDFDPQQTLETAASIPDERFLIQQSKIFEQEGDCQQYACVIRMILIPYFYDLIKQQENILIGNKHKKHPFTMNVRRIAYQMINNSPLKYFVEKLGDSSEVSQNVFRGLNNKDLYHYVMKLVEVLFMDGKYHEMFHVLCFACFHPKIAEINFNAFEQLLVLASIKSQNFAITFEILRDRIKSFYAAQNLVHLPRMYISMGFSYSHYKTEAALKFLHRLHEAHPEDIRIRMFVANNSLVNGMYKSALENYAVILKERPDDPLVLLLSSICFLNYALNRDVTSSHDIATRAIAAIGKYQNCRRKNGPMQEVHYNIGRLLHQIGLLSQAVFWYEKVLAEEDPLVAVNDPKSDGGLVYVPSKKYSMKPMAALNYIEIIKDVNPGKARLLRRKYCVL